MKILQKRLTFLSCAFLLVVLGVVHTSNAASISRQIADVAEGRSDDSGDLDMELPLFRQAEDSSAEDSDEDDDVDDAEQLQQSILRQQQAEEESFDSLESSEDGDLDEFEERKVRRRRDTAVTEAHQITENNQPSEVQKLEEENVVAAEALAEAAPASSAAVATAPTTSQPSRPASVLILIRNALKKVTTELPTAEVATNALQYFQLFEHFIQQTIEQVIGAVDDDDEEVTTIKNETEVTSAVDQQKEPEATVSETTEQATVQEVPAMVEQMVTDMIEKQPEAVEAQTAEKEVAANVL